MKAHGDSTANIGTMTMQPVEVVFEMETGDPDDVLTLIFLLGHPGANLRAIGL